MNWATWGSDGPSGTRVGSGAGRKLVVVSFAVPVFLAIQFVVVLAAMFFAGSRVGHE